MSQILLGPKSYLGIELKVFKSSISLFGALQCFIVSWILPNRYLYAWGFVFNSLIMYYFKHKSKVLSYVSYKHYIQMTFCDPITQL